jgi:hypothetical protein
MGCTGWNGAVPQSEKQVFVMFLHSGVHLVGFPALEQGMQTGLHPRIRVCSDKQ